MKIEIKNLGPISKFTFDVEKDLHLIYGKNSVGKSYAIYCVYILLKKFNAYHNSAFDFIGSITSIYKNELESLTEKLKQIADKNEDERIDIGKELLEIFEFFFNKIFSDEITDSFNNSFSSLANLKNVFTNRKPEIKIISNDLSISLHLDRLNSIKAKNIILNKPLEILKEKINEDYFLYFGSIKMILWEMTTTEGLFMALMQMINRFTESSRNIINQIYFLPSSRSGLYLALSSFSPIIAELSKSRFQLKNKIALPSISEPIADYFIPLASANNKKVNKQFEVVIKQIEEDILQGTVTVDNDNKRILFQPKNSVLKLDLSTTSSMVSEIAPIVTYFKHIINSNPESDEKASLFSIFEKDESTKNKRRKSIIFIEEPEAHLHPEIQVRLMEIFAELTKHNMKVVITSHSNYMFNKLVNMILAKKVDVKKVVVNNMVMTKVGSIVDENMTVTEDGVEDFNFSQTSEKLYEERMNIVD